MKILFHGETPMIDTGAGQVSKHLIQALLNLDWSLEVVGVNHFLDLRFDVKKWPDRVHFHYCKMDDAYNKDTAFTLIRLGNFDLLFLTGDLSYVSDILEQVPSERAYKVLAHVAIDCDFPMPTYMESLRKCDMIVCMAEYGRQVIHRQAPDLDSKVVLIPHWFEPDVFRPLENRQEVRQRLLPMLADDTFLVMSVNRNQRRKDLSRVMYSIHKVDAQGPEAKLYMHAARVDIGGDLASQAIIHGMMITGTDSEVIYSPENYSAPCGYPRDLLNELYNCADVVVSCAQGEGWGLSTSEAMAARIPFIGPDNTTFPSLLGAEPEGSYLNLQRFRIGERGLLVQSGGDDLWSVHYGWGNEARPLTSVVGMVQALTHVYEYRDAALERAKRARDYTLAWTGKDYEQAWEKLFTEVAAREAVIA